MPNVVQIIKNLHLQAPGSARGSPASRRASVIAPRAQQKRGDAPPSQQQRLKVDLFETAGTPQDRGSWEPFGGDNPVASFIASVDFSEPFSFDGEEKTEYDPLRDGPLRYLGYANELGEAFAAWLFPGGVSLSYAVAIGYVLFDTVDKYNKTRSDAKSKLSARSLPPSVDTSRLVGIIGAERGVDTLVWQLIASVAAPGYTIHTVVAAVTSLVKAVEAQPAVATALQQAPAELVEVANKSLPTALGLLTIPFIVHPIDGAVHALLNATLRPAMRRYVCQSGGTVAGLAVCSKECVDK